MDTDGTHNTAVQVAGVSTSIINYTYLPGWSPTGGSICFTQWGSATAPDTIKAIDVSVNSSGVPVGSNLRTIVGLPDQTVRLNGAYWSSTSAVGMIAYTTRDGATNSLYVVSQSGGTPTKICSVDTAWMHFGLTLKNPTWSPDDSRLAVCRDSSANASTATSMILIFNTSTWACVDSIAITGGVFGLEWSRSGSMNKLAFVDFVSGSNHLYYCDPTTGATPTTYGLVGSYPTWSPNNSSVMYVNSSGLTKNIPLTSTTTSVSSFGGAGVKWKR